MKDYYHENIIRYKRLIRKMRLEKEGVNCEKDVDKKTNSDK